MREEQHMENYDELCRLINSMKLVQSVRLENHYDAFEDRFDKNLTMFFSPELIYYGERLLKVTFYKVREADIGEIMGGIYSPFIEIRDISEYGWEDIHFSVSEIEGHFGFKFGSCEYEWTESIEIDSVHKNGLNQ